MKLFERVSRLHIGVITGALTLFIAGCGEKQEPAQAEQKTQQPQAELELGLIAFGDSGYDYKYLKKKQYIPANSTWAAFVESKRKKWLKDKYPEKDFSEPPGHFVDSVGSFVDASGLFPVASAMQSYCQSASCEFSVMLGDNIYPDGAEANEEDAARFDRLFTQPYGKMGQGNPDYRIYTTLGNHDWDTSREGAMAQVQFMENTRPFYMDGIIYSVKPPAGRGEIELFIIDTDMLLTTTVVYEDQLNSDGSERPSTDIDEPDEWKKPQTSKEKNMIAWLEKSLQQSTARWKFVLGHHPIWSTGGSKFTQARALRGLILPTLCRYADVYFAGHEHTLELHEDTCESVLGKGSNKPLLQILSGAAAKQRGVNTAFKAYQDVKEPYNNAIWVKGMVWGFSHIQIKGDSARVNMLTIPDTGPAVPKVVFSHSFNRRSD